MLSINNLLVNLYAKVLDVIFPVSSDLSFFLNMSVEALEELVYTETDATNTIRSLFPYQHPLIKASIRALKYKRSVPVAKRYAEILALQIHSRTDDTSYVLIPLPASKRRMHLHGFNQCEILTKDLFPLLDTRYVHYPNGLQRTDSHLSQTTLSKSDRLANVQGAFVADAFLFGKRVIIIDDVWTTGATARAAMAACRSVGAHHVEVWTIAH